MLNGTTGDTHQLNLLIFSSVAPSSLSPSSHLLLLFSSLFTLTF
jgi:hypothetical protein